MNNSTITYHSHHYFIGKRLKKNDAVKIREVQQDILNHNDFLQPVDKINNIYTPFIYLGYFNESIEYKLNQLLVPEMFAVAEKFGSMKCFLKNYSLTGQSRNYKYVGLTYDTPNNYLENIIIPYLKSYLDKYTGVNLVYENVPMIPLFRLRKREIDEFLRMNPHSKNNKGKSVFRDIKLPELSFDSKTKQRYFYLDSIDLLRATPMVVKKGKKSFNEALHIDSVLSIPLAGQLKH